MLSYPMLMPVQIVFSLLTTFFFSYDCLLLALVIFKRWKKTLRGPFIYPVFMTICGIVSKVCEIFMVMSWPICEYLEVSYEVYRQWIGEEVTLLFTTAYLIPLFLNWIMTIHRISIFVYPVRATIWFSEKRLLVYSSLTTLSVVVWLLIPYFSNCTMNFNALTSRLESACAPERHPITLFQNMFLIYVPLASMLVNAGMVVGLKIARRLNPPTATWVSQSNVKRENVLLRQALFIGIYLSVYELLYLHLRLRPDHFESLPIEWQSMSYDVRLLAIGSLNFMVYFWQTKTSRDLLLGVLGRNANKIGLISFVDLLIPYYSSCSINFHAHPATWISDCAPEKHMLTWFQNKYTIYFPVSAMLVNFFLILYMKIKRGVVSSSRAMLRTVAGTAVYLSIYEIGSLYIRLLPGSFEAQSLDFKDDFYMSRILTICSLNFFVYFVITKTTRRLILDFYVLKKKNQVRVITVTGTN